RWLRDWLDSGDGLDWMVRELVGLPGSQVRYGNIYRFDGRLNANPTAFYSAKDYQPEEVASAVARLFLGINLGCAQCHHHPFASWKREQFWSFAAFFGGLDRQRLIDDSIHEITIPSTGKKVRARFLDGKQPIIGENGRSRVVLADWIVAKDNPYFAR